MRTPDKESAPEVERLAARRFALFAYDQYYPSGGWSDFVGFFATKQAAEAVDTECDYEEIIDLWMSEPYK